MLIAMGCNPMLTLILVFRADAVYDLHDHETVRKEKYLELWGLGWRVVEVERQPNYALEYPKKLAMAVFVKGDLAVLALKGTTKKGASDWHLNLTSIVSGYPPCGPLEEAARLVKKYKDQKKRVMVTGHSLGGYMAEVVATNLEISGVGFCAPGSGWHAGKPHSGFQNINFLHDVAGNVAAAIYRHPQWSVYVEDSGPLPCHSMAYMVMCMENPERKGWTNQNVVSNCKSEPTSGAGGATGALIKIAGIASGFYTNCNTAGRPASPV